MVARAEFQFLFIALTHSSSTRWVDSCRVSFQATSDFKSFNKAAEHSWAMLELTPERLNRIMSATDAELIDILLIMHTGFSD